MKIDSTTIVYFAVSIFLAVSFFKIVHWARKVFVRKEDVDLLKTELHARNMKIDAFQTEFDVLKTEIIALKIKAQPANFLPYSGAPMLKDAHAKGDDTRSRGLRMTEAPIAPMMPRSTLDDTWVRNTNKENFDSQATVTKK
jgi:hypothetical protein